MLKRITKFLSKILCCVWVFFGVVMFYATAVFIKNEPLEALAAFLIGCIFLFLAATEE